MENSIGPDEANGRFREYKGWGADETDQEAIIKVFSSDNWEFWISHSLARLSLLLRTRIMPLWAAPQNTGTMFPQTILRFTDPEIELGANIDKVFRIIKQKDDDDPKLPQTIRDYLDDNVAYFFKKYEMTKIIDAIKRHLNELLNESPPSGGRHVLVAAILEDWDLCGRLVMTLDAWQGDIYIEEDEYMRQMLDWRGWTPEIIRDLSKISQRFLWAVCQVGTKHAGASVNGGISYAAVGPDLARVMNTPDENNDEVVKDWVQGDTSWWERPNRG